MKTPAYLAIAALLTAAPAFAQDAAGQPPEAALTNAAPAQPVTPAPERDASGVYQVFRVTDSQLNCEQIIAEMNTLNATIKTQTEQAARQQNTNRAGRQVAGGAVGGALGGFARGAIARNVPGLGIAGAMAAAGATDAASAAVGSAVANSGQPGAAPATASNEQQRLNRVSQLFAAKGC